MSFKWNKEPIWVAFETELEREMFDILQQSYMMAQSIVVKGMIKNLLFKVIGKRLNDEDLARVYSRIGEENGYK